MKRIVFDIETVGVDFSTLDKISQEYFLRFADTPEKIKEAQDALSFYPLTAQIVAIAMLEMDSGLGAVYYQNGSGPSQKTKEGDIVFVSGTEQDILSHFWRQLERYQQFVTFNGRCFDCPFIMIRSALNKIRATRNLLPYRYNPVEHVDLLDQLTFYDAMKRRFSLHMWCQAFGIPSPKHDMTGLQVREFFNKGHYQEIARYCMKDVAATKELGLYWYKFLKF